jgi:hypothetical protein
MAVSIISGGNRSTRRKPSTCHMTYLYHFGLGLMVFNATFNNISVISWWSVLLVEETGVPEEINVNTHQYQGIYHFQIIHIYIYLLYIFCSFSRAILIFYFGILPTVWHFLLCFSFYHIFNNKK